MSAEPAVRASGYPDVRNARSWLFVPGDRGDRFAKAAASGADVVVCDLEDAVAAEAKASSRTEVARWLADGGLACVRVNAHGTPFHDADVAALAGVPGLLAVMLPKAEDSRVLAAVGDALGRDTPVVALVETALGQHRVHEVAAAPGVARLAFGSIDLALDLGAEDASFPLLFARSSLVLASRVAGLPAPVDGVTPQLDDPALVQAAAATAAGLGFGGKLCVHPRQVDAVHAGFRPGAEEVRHARRVLAAVTDGGARRLDGQMLDRPVVERARQVLRRAGTGPGGPGESGHDMSNTT
jgi:citrate lyase subunit beta/citryl-CoA lyase